MGPIAGPSSCLIGRHDCPNSCYRCPRSYRNQAIHKMLDWRQTITYLRALTGEAVVEEGPIKPAAPAAPPASGGGLLGLFPSGCTVAANSHGRTTTPSAHLPP